MKYRRVLLAYVWLARLCFDVAISDCMLLQLTYPLVLRALKTEGNRSPVGVIRACDNDEHPNNKIYYHLVNCKLQLIIVNKRFPTS